MNWLSRLRAAWRRAEVHELEAMFRNGVVVGKKLGYDEGVVAGGQAMLENILRDPEAYLQRRDRRLN
jgi:hypothetical protein